MSERGLANLVALTRLVGYVRYFHPSDEASDTDWGAFTIAAVDTVERASGSMELAAILRGLFRPIAPTVRIDTHPVSIEPASLIPSDSVPVSVVKWLHHGFSGGTRVDASFWSRRSRTRLEGTPTLGQDAVFSANLGGGLWCAVPLALFADSLTTLPRGGIASFASRGAARQPSPADRATRIADVVLFWNIAQHFYPYFDVVDTDWHAALSRALRHAAVDADAHSFYNTMCVLVAQLHDGHGRVAGEGDSVLTLSVVWDWVEDRLVITQVLQETPDGPRRGDIVLSIDGESVSKRLAEVEPLIGAATPQRMRWGALLPLARGAGRDSVVLELQAISGARRHVTLGRNVDPGAYRWDRPDRIADVRPGILYLDLTRCSESDLDSCSDRLVAARGIVFDMRGYPHDISHRFLGHLADTPLSSPRWGIPLVARPDHEGMVFDFSSWTVPPAEPRITARCAFLMDGRDQSAAETLLQIVAHYRLGELVGQPTAGTDGTSLTAELPGGYRVSFTGMNALKQDGSRIQGVGVKPTVSVTRTIAGVAAERDELLEKALEVVTR